MGNSLLNYLNERLTGENNLNKNNPKNVGPVITFSREVGCNGLKLANLLALKLNTSNYLPKWKVLSKEIFYESAKELNLDPKKVRKTFKKSERFTFEEILAAFSDKNYKSEQKIAKTVIDVIRSFAIDGFCIIVGRAGHIITHDFENALHVRLTAPLDYRIETIKTNNSLSEKEAIAFIQKVENERLAFRKAINKESLREELFDVTLNRGSFSDNEIIEILSFIIAKKLKTNKMVENTSYF